MAKSPSFTFSSYSFSFHISNSLFGRELHASVKYPLGSKKPVLESNNAQTHERYGNESKDNRRPFQRRRTERVSEGGNPLKNSKLEPA